MDRRTVEKIEPFIKDYINTLITEYGVDQEETELYETWVETTEKNLLSVEEGCTFKLLRGLRKGDNCNLKKAKDSEYCLRHKNMKSNKLILKKHISLKKYWDPVTKFVFENDEGRVVIGKTTKATKGESCPILKLTDNDLEKCKVRELTYKPSPKKII